MTLYYYEYFYENVKCLDNTVSGNNLLIRPRVLLYLYSGIKYNLWQLWACQELTNKPKTH